jgi:hypothetical protein
MPMLNHSWGRDDAAGTWPHPKPVWTIAALLFAVISAAAVGAYRYMHLWTPLQRFYLPTYVRSDVMSGLGLTTTGRYRLLRVADRTGSRLALDDDVDEVDAVDEVDEVDGVDRVKRVGEAGTITFALSQAGLALGDRRLVWHAASYNHAKLHAFLGHWIYRDRSLLGLVMPAVWSGVAVFAAALLIAIPKDLHRARERRQGRRLKGPEIVTASQFTRRHRADGMAFVQKRRLFLPSPCVRIPLAIESSHFLITGDTGTGKSVLIRQMLQQLEARGETAIVYDPVRRSRDKGDESYTAQFYRPERGDVILNPLDARCPYWSPGDECQHEAETLTLATSLFPDQDHGNPFFTQAARRVFAHLLTFRPSPQELVRWLRQDAEIDMRVKGTEYATMIGRQGPSQRNAVLGTLKMAADTLRLLPAERDATGRWSAAGWSTGRTGWVFLTMMPSTQARLLPLTSLWLDMLVLRLMNQGQDSSRKTWFVLDEVASLQRLPQLHTALTENRKSNNPIVLGFQGRSQIETRYGRDAEAMLSQPATRIFLGTGEPEAARWIADAIGDVEIERLRESRSSGSGGRHSYGLERQVEPLVMASEISGLAPLRGFLKLGNLVVRLNLRFVDLPKLQPAFVERAGRRDDSIDNLESRIRNSQESRNSSQGGARDSRDSTASRTTRAPGESDGEPTVVRGDGQRRVLTRTGRRDRAPGLFGDE